LICEKPLTMEINPGNYNNYHNKQQLKTRLHIIPFLKPVGEPRDTVISPNDRNTWPRIQRSVYLFRILVEQFCRL